MIHRKCPLCQRDNRDEPDSRYSCAEWTIKACAACGLVYLQNVLPYDQLADTHAWSKLFVSQRQTRRRREPVLDRLSQHFKALRLKYLWRDKAPLMIDRFIRPGHLLDLGCGTGKVLRQLKADYTPYGIEIDQHAAVVAQWYAIRRGGRVVHHDVLSGLRSLEDQQFDGIVMRSYLEHENEPQSVLSQTYRVLKPEGRILLKVPNFASLNRYVRGRRWCGFRYPDHVNYFTPQTLVAMIETAHLQVIHFGLRYRLPTSDNMWLIAQRPAANNRACRSAA